MDDGKSFWYGLGIGLFIAFAVWSGTSDSNYEEQQSLEIDYQDKYASLRGDLSRAYSCIDGLQSMLSSVKSNLSFAESAVSTRDDEYETIYDALQETESYISSASSELIGQPADCAILNR